MKSITYKDTAYMDENRLVRSLVSLHHASYHGTLRVSHSLDADEQGNEPMGQVDFVDSRGCKSGHKRNCSTGYVGLSVDLKSAKNHLSARLTRVTAALWPR